MQHLRTKNAKSASEITSEAPLFKLLDQTDSTECVIEGEGMDMQPMIVKRADIYENNGESEIAEEDLHF